MGLDAQKRARYDCDDQEKMLMKWVFSACLQVLPHEQIFRIWEALTRKTQIDFALPNIFIKIEIFFLFFHQSKVSGKIPDGP